MFVYLTGFKGSLDRLSPSRRSAQPYREAREKSWPTTHRLTGVHLGEVALQLAHSPLQKAADGLVGVFLVGGLDDEGHRVLHCALVHAARGPGPAPLSSSPGTRRRSSRARRCSRGLGLGAGSAAGAELPGGAGGAHRRAGAPGTAATGDRSLSRTPAGAKGEGTTRHPERAHTDRAEPLHPRHRLGLRPLRRVKWRPEAAALPPPRAAPARRHRGAPKGRHGGRGPGRAEATRAGLGRPGRRAPCMGSLCPGPVRVFAPLRPLGSFTRRVSATEKLKRFST